MATLPTGFQQGSGALPAVYDSKGNLDSRVSRVLGATATGTEAAGAVTFSSGAPKMAVTLSAVLNAGAGFALTINNPSITTNSLILASVVGTTATAAATRDALTVNVTSIAAGVAVLQVYNGDAANTSAAPVIHVAVL